MLRAWLRDRLAPWRSLAALRADNERLDRLSRTDPLTGVLNRRGLDGALAALDGAWCGLMIDLDEFRRVNRRFGFTMGDAVLRAVVVRLDHALGTGARLGRIGGDEFLAVLPGTPLAVAERAAEHARDAVAAVEVPDLGPITCSIGVGGFHERPASLEAAIGSLQRALDASKGAGKNRIALVK